MLTQLEAMLNSLVQPSEPLRSALWPPAFTGMAVGRVLPILRAAGCVTGVAWEGWQGLRSDPAVADTSF